MVFPLLPTARFRQGHKSPARGTRRPAHPDTSAADQVERVAVNGFRSRVSRSDASSRQRQAEPEIDLPKLAAVSSPALVLPGDRDEVTLKHGAAVAAALGDGRLAVLPGTHGLPVELPEVVNPLLVSFPAVTST